MCGIVGSFNPLLSHSNLVKKISDSLLISNHRGPDDRGIYSNKECNFAFGMNRLSIIDIKNGAQPFFSEDKRYCLIFNGEIVNSENLKKKLINKGIKFKTKNSDTEVLLKMLSTFGEDCLPELNGMFAFCFFDIKKKKLLLARDRFGIKPLYFFFKRNNFSFASELKTLIGIYEDELNINKESLSDYFSLMFVPSPNTIFENIYKLCPGEKINFDLNSKKLMKSNWNNHNFKINNNLDLLGTRDKIKELTENAVTRWTQADVKICNSLSGGVDSSVISSILGDKKYAVTNFSLGFLDSTDRKFDEIDIAKELSNKWKQDHIISRLNPSKILDKLDQILESIHEPYGGGLPSWSIYEEIAKKKFKVAFNGTGIDEFFGNYGKWQKLKSIFSNKISFEKFEKDFFDIRYYFTNYEKKKLLNFDHYSFETTSAKFYKIFNECEGDLYDKSALLDIKTQLTDEFLQICDNFSMFHSLEVRPTYLDTDLTNFLFTVPSKYRVGNINDLKVNFKESFKIILTKKVLNAKKRGFILPVENWLKNSLKPLLNKYLSKKKIDEHGLINNNIYNEIVIPFLNRPKLISKLDKYHRKQTQVWSLLMFQLWFEKHINKNNIKI